MKKIILPLIMALAFLASCSVEETRDEFKDDLFGKTIVEDDPVCAVDEESEMMVYITPHGKRYHISTCGSISGHDITELTVSDAEEMGRTPCHRCNPDTHIAYEHNVSSPAPLYATNTSKGEVYTSGYGRFDDSQTAASGYTVYITPHGKRYHRSSCWHIKGHDVTAVDVSKAQSSGRTPCKDCKP
jgi:hypothetical protein